MAESKPVDVDRESKATPIEAVEPVEMPAILGATFAERAAAAKKSDRKQVDPDGTENKAVAKKSASKKS